MVSCRVRTVPQRALFPLAVAVVMWLAALPAAVAAAPGGLNVIPTAGVYGPGVVSLEHQAQGEGRLFVRDCGDLALVQVGVARGLGIGVGKCAESSAPEPYLASARISSAVSGRAHTFTSSITPWK